MSQSKPRKKIRFDREVLRKLTQEQGQRVVGGVAVKTDSKPYACQSSNDPTAC